MEAALEIIEKALRGLATAIELAGSSPLASSTCGLARADWARTAPEGAPPPSPLLRLANGWQARTLQWPSQHTWLLAQIPPSCWLPTASAEALQLVHFVRVRVQVLRRCSRRSCLDTF